MTGEEATGNSRDVEENTRKGHERTREERRGGESRAERAEVKVQQKM
jgi:hypothetical protein